MSSVLITSKDNPQVKLWRQLAQDSSAYRKQGAVWLEGDHLCRALLTRRFMPSHVVCTPDGLALASSWELSETVKLQTVSEAVMRHMSGLESPAPVACVWSPPRPTSIEPHSPTVVLDRLQDPGNAGSMLRTAAAMGFGQVLALKGTVGLWSPKVLRAGMGAHMGLHVVEGLAMADLQALHVPMLATSSHHGEWVHLAALPWPCAWVLGHEGQGVSSALQQQARLTVRIAQPGGEESLNVAAAAAICMHASAVRSSL